MKIAVLGSAASSIGRAPFVNSAHAAWQQNKVDFIQRSHDSVPGDWDIWGCSPGCWAVCPRATRWFEVHRWEANVPWFSPQYVQFLRDFKGPVYTGGAVPEIPNHVVFPIDHLEEKFSSYFMTSTLALMMAEAIDTIEAIRRSRESRRKAKAELDAGIPVNSTDLVDLPVGIDPAELEKTDDDDVIGLWGVDMAAADEYAYQRPGCQFFVLEAMRRGIGVYLPPESDLMRPQPVYGISEWDHNYIKLTSRAREITGRMQEVQRAMGEHGQLLAGLQGENHALQAFVSTWTSPYGMLPGMVIRQAVGTGLGSGITHFDGRPVSRMRVEAPPVMQAMAEPPEVQFAHLVALKLKAYGSEIGASVPPDVQSLEGLLESMVAESRTGRCLSAIVQPFVRAGESTNDAMVRLLSRPPVVQKRAAMKATKRRR